MRSNSGGADRNPPKSRQNPRRSGARCGPSSARVYQGLAHPTVGLDDAAGGQVHRRFQPRRADRRAVRCGEQFGKSVRAELGLLRCGGVGAAFPVRKRVLHDAQVEDALARCGIAGIGMICMSVLNGVINN